MPKHLQGSVHRAWRAWRRDFGDAGKLRAYEAATEAAIAAVP